TGTGIALGDISLGCTPVILSGDSRAVGPGWHGSLGGGCQGRWRRARESVGWGIRSVLDSGSTACSGVPLCRAGSSGNESGKRSMEEEEKKERESKLIRMELEIEKLQDENERWQKVNNSLWQKLGKGSRT
ncbi:unnamed protein product, partial [Choristocarpus tenellus]